MLKVPDDVRKVLLRELKLAGKSEIGGVMMGEQLGPGEFLLKEISVQHAKGTIATFIRDATEALKAILAFFTKTENRYDRFNYLGEWHSHPSFSVQPSQKDHETMLEMAADPTVGANFLLLLIIKLDADGELDASLHFYTPTGEVFPVEVDIQP